jgi:Rieske Fe-S protein
MAYHELQPSEGQVVKDKHVALYRDEHGFLHALSSICTHEECEVEWNKQEKSWDCPCHGSRFTADGHVINGPAVEPLPRREVDE